MTLHRGRGDAIVYTSHQRTAIIYILIIEKKILGYIRKISIFFLLLSELQNLYQENIHFLFALIWASTPLRVLVVSAYLWSRAASPAFFSFSAIAEEAAASFLAWCKACLLLGPLLLQCDRCELCPFSLLLSIIFHLHGTSGLIGLFEHFHFIWTCLFLP